MRFRWKLLILLLTLSIIPIIELANEFYPVL